jgi:hypothetical protein
MTKQSMQVSILNSNVDELRLVQGVQVLSPLPEEELTIPLVAMLFHLSPLLPYTTFYGCPIANSFAHYSLDTASDWFRLTKPCTHSSSGICGHFHVSISK